MNLFYGTFLVNLYYFLYNSDSMFRLKVVQSYSLEDKTLVGSF